MSLSLAIAATETYSNRATKWAPIISQRSSAFMDLKVKYFVDDIEIASQEPVFFRSCWEDVFDS